MGKSQIKAFKLLVKPCDVKKNNKKDMNNQVRLKGYVHNVRRASKSGTGSFRCFNFSLQVSESRKRRVVCYDPGKEKLLKGYQESREPVKLLNFSKRRSAESALEEDIVLSKRSRIESVNNNDIVFEYDEATPQEAERTFTTIGTIESLRESEVISVKGCLSLRADCVRQIVMKNGSVVTMLDRCTITDDSGTIRLTLWGEMIQEVTNHSCYSVENVLVKCYDFARYLTTTHSTRIIPTEENFPHISEQLFDSLFDVERISVEKISFAQKLKKWLSCCECGKQLSDVTSMSMRIVKCAKCKTVQPVSSCSMKASARIAVRDSDYQLIWLKAFTPVLEEMLNQPAPDVTLQSSEEEIYEQLFEQRNFTIEYDKSSLVIKNIYFESS